MNIILALLVLLCVISIESLWEAYPSYKLVFPYKYFQLLSKKGGIRVPYQIGYIGKNDGMKQSFHLQAGRKMQISIEFYPHILSYESSKFQVLWNQQIVLIPKIFDPDSHTIFSGVMVTSVYGMNTICIRSSKSPQFVGVGIVQVALVDIQSQYSQNLIKNSNFQVPVLKYHQERKFINYDAY